MPTGSGLVVGVVLPDILGTYSDAGNAAVLARRMLWRGAETTIVDLTSDRAPSTGCDIYLLGGGEDAAQSFAADWLRRHHGLRQAMTHSAVVLAVCAGMQILGRTFTDASGHVQRGADVLDLTTTARRTRAVGEVVARPTVDGIDVLTGFENHRGGTTLGSSLQPFAVVERGVGNGSCRDDVFDGAVSTRIVATYLHGPVLARNPTLADHLLRLATGAELNAIIEPPDLAGLRISRLDRPSLPGSTLRRLIRHRSTRRRRRRH